MTTSILYKELQQNKNLSPCYQFWNIPETPAQNLFTQIKSKIEDESFFLQLENLNAKESIFLYTLMQNDGQVTSAQLMQNKLFSKEEIEPISKSLKEKYLIFIRKSISQIKIVPHSYTIYPELQKQLKKITILTLSDLTNLSIPTEEDHNKIELDEKWQKLLYVNLGLYPIRLLKVNNNQKMLEEYPKEHYNIKLFFHNDNFTVVTHHPELLQINIKTDSPLIPQKYGLNFLSRIYLLYYHIKIKGIYFTSKKNIRKHDFNLLKKIFYNDHDLLESVTQFLEESKLMEIINNQLKPLPALAQFLRKPLREKLLDIIDNKSKLKKIFYLINQLDSEHFSVWNIAKTYYYNQIHNGEYYPYNIFDDPELNINDYEQQMQLLVHLGLVNIQENGYIVSPLGRNLLIEGPIENNDYLKKDGIIVTNDHSLLVYTEQINDYHKFLLELFADKNSDGMVCQYNFNKASIQRGIFLGFSTSDFIECLESNSTKSISEHILYNIKSWASKIKKIVIKEVTLLEGDEELIHLLQYEKNISNHIEVIGKNHLLCKNNSLPSYIESDDPIYIIREDEDLSYENH